MIANLVVGTILMGGLLFGGGPPEGVGPDDPHLSPDPFRGAVCGLVTYYGPGVVEEVIGNRGIELEPGMGRGITIDQSLIGSLVSFYIKGQWWPPYQVVDVGGPPGFNRKGLIGEVGYEEALEMKLSKPTWGCYLILRRGDR